VGGGKEKEMNVSVVIVSMKVLTWFACAVFAKCTCYFPEYWLDINKQEYNSLREDLSMS
jgi:hypothetical protein